MRRLVPLALLLAAAGCGGGSATRPQAAPSTAATASSTTVPVTAEKGRALPKLRRIAVSDGRVVFTFSSRVAHARGLWQQELHDSAGNVVSVAGGSLLVMRFEPAQARSYAGPASVTAGGPVLQVVRGGDFEGLVTWAIGLDTQRSYRVTRSGDRVIVRFGL